MMGLVAYGSSGESENESDNEVESIPNETKKILVVPMNGAGPSSAQDATLKSTVTPPQGIKTGLHSKLPAPKTNVTETQEDMDAEESSSVTSKLPAPKHHTAPSLLQSSVVLSKNTKGKSKKGTVKIMIPSLSDFPEEENEPKARKKVQPSAKGSGLFALLPPPKTAPVKEAKRSLVPNVLTRKPTPVAMKKVATKIHSQAVKRKQPDSDPESDGENDSIDFFSLNKEDKLPDIPMIVVDVPATSSVGYDDPSSSYQQSNASGNYQYQPYEQQIEETALPQADSGQDFISFEGGSELQLDEEALTKLCGRKGRKREEIQIVDVSGDSIMPDQREWLTKQLTEEQPRSSKSKLFGGSSLQKRKHQITYLAHMAKENEIELKNQWANNRQTRKQTQSKYGF